MNNLLEEAPVAGPQPHDARATPGTSYRLKPVDDWASSSPPAKPLALCSEETGPLITVGKGEAGQIGLSSAQISAYTVDGVLMRLVSPYTYVAAEPVPEA